jgi:hypothetical protein
VRGKPEYRELPGTGSEAEQAEAARAYQLSWHNSIVEDLFVGQLQSTITCAGCGGTSHCFDPFYSLALPLPSKKAGAPVPLQVGGLGGQGLGDCGQGREAAEGIPRCCLQWRAVDGSNPTTPL